MLARSWLAHHFLLSYIHTQLFGDYFEHGKLLLVLHVVHFNTLICFFQFFSSYSWNEAQVCLFWEIKWSQPGGCSSVLL